jgi:hypothetical protein
MSHISGITPSPKSACSVITVNCELDVMASIELQDSAETVPYEIGCPRCFSVMTLFFEAESENPFYACDDCDFILHTTGERG